MKPIKYLVGLSLFVLIINTQAFGTLNLFQPAFSIQTNISPRGVAVGNVFGDGTQSFLVANFGSSTFIGQTTPVNFLNSQNSNIQVFSPVPNGLELRATIPTASSPRGLCTFDMNHRGRQDIVVTAYDAGLVQIFEWQNGQFVKLDEEPTLKMPVGVAMGLVKAGGTEILAVADYGANSISLFQVKDGKLGKRVDIKVDDGPTQIAIGNLGGNGVNEVAVVCLPANKIDILSKNVNGSDDDLSSYTVTQTLNLPDGSLPSDLKVVDLNGDGMADLVVSDFGSNTISIFLQQKNGSLVMQSGLQTSGSHPNGLTVADLHKDGQKEIIVANRDSDSIDIFQMIGGQYQLAQTLNVSSDSGASFGPVEVGVLDAGNGKLDLVASHMRSNSIKVLTEDLPQPTPTPIVLGGLESGTSFSSTTTYCYPDPSHDGKVTIHFTLDRSSTVLVQIFDLAGDLVWSEGLGPSQTGIGTNTVSWQGVNQNGKNLASGLYLCSVHANGQTITKKIAIIR